MMALVCVLIVLKLIKKGESKMKEFLIGMKDLLSAKSIQLFMAIVFITIIIAYS